MNKVEFLDNQNAPFGRPWCPNAIWNFTPITFFRSLRISYDKMATSVCLSLIVTGPFLLTYDLWSNDINQIFVNHVTPSRLHSYQTLRTAHTDLSKWTAATAGTTWQGKHVDQSTSLIRRHRTYRRHIGTSWSTWHNMNNHNFSNKLFAFRAILMRPESSKHVYNYSYMILILKYIWKDSCRDDGSSALLFIEWRRFADEHYNSLKRDKNDQSLFFCWYGLLLSNALSNKAAHRRSIQLSI